MFFTSTKWKSGNVAAVFFALCLLAFPLSAQVLQQERFELALDAHEPSYEITGTDLDGLFLHRYVTRDRTDYLDLIRLDTALAEVWRGALATPANLIPVGRQSDGEFLYFLFKEIDSKDYELFQIEFDSGGYYQFHIPSFIRFNPTEFQVTPTAVLIGGYFNRVPLVLHFNMATRQSKVLPGLFNEDGELTQIKTFDDGTFQVMISARNFRKEKTLWIKNYQPDGSLIDNLSLNTEGNKSLIFGRSTQTINDMQLVAGVYGFRNSEYSRGIFITSIDPNGVEQSRYYNFGDLENFFNYMKARRSNRIKERIERRKIKGKKIKFNYRFLVHDIVEYKDNYVLLGEAFYPQYTSLSSGGYGGFMQPYSFARGSMIRGDQVFDGYRYTHAVIIGFDKNGKLLWDNSFEINDVKSFTLEQFVKIDVRDDKIVLLYLFDNKIRTKIIQDNKVLEGKSVDAIKTTFEHDVLVKERAGKNELTHWYDQYFFAGGVQYIENETDPAARGRRRVFFVNKILNP